MNRESHPANPPVQTKAKRILINAREFLEAFRGRSDDYYLMAKFSLKPKDLRKIYDQLMERGLLAEHEYNQREKKSLEVEEKTVSRATTPPVVSTADSTTEGTGTFTTFPSESRSQPPPAPHVSTGASSVVQVHHVQTFQLCPQCNMAKDPDYPDSCPCCGVVFAKIKQSEKSGKVVVWTDKTGRFR